MHSELNKNIKFSVDYQTFCVRELVICDERISVNLIYSEGVTVFLSSQAECFFYENFWFLFFWMKTLDQVLLGAFLSKFLYAFFIWKTEKLHDNRSACSASVATKIENWLKTKFRRSILCGIYQKSYFNVKSHILVLFLDKMTIKY